MSLQTTKSLYVWRETRQVQIEKNVELGPKPAWSCDEKIGGVVARNPLELWLETAWNRGENRFEL